MFVSDQCAVALSGDVAAKTFLDPQGKRRTVMAGGKEMGLLLAASPTPEEVIEFVTLLMKSIQEDMLPAFGTRYTVTTASFYWFELGQPRYIVIDFESDVIRDKLQFHHDIVRNQSLLVGDINSPPRDFHKVLENAELLQIAKDIDDPKDQLNFILGKESDLSPGDVGPPFTIYKLTPGGGSWVQDIDGICASGILNPHSK
jgi:hypothetical protein